MCQQLKHPIGALCKMAQFSRKLLCFFDGETTAVRMPCGTDQVEDFCNVIWQYTNSIISPSILCFGAMANSNHLSIARGH